MLEALSPSFSRLYRLYSERSGGENWVNVLAEAILSAQHLQTQYQQVVQRRSENKRVIQETQSKKQAQQAKLISNAQRTVLLSIREELVKFRKSLTNLLHVCSTWSNQSIRQLSAAMIDQYFNSIEQSNLQQTQNQEVSSFSAQNSSQQQLQSSQSQFPVQQQSSSISAVED